MTNSNCKFSIPFSGDDPVVFFDYLSQREQNVNDVYLGDVRAFPQFRSVQKNGNEVIDSFFEHIPCKDKRKWLLFFTMNQVFLDVKSVQTATELIDQYNVVQYLRRMEYDGVIVANPYIAAALRQEYPELVLCSSVNTFTGEHIHLFSADQLHVFDIYQILRSDLFAMDENKALKLKQKIGCKALKVLVNQMCKRRCDLLYTHVVDNENKNLLESFEQKNARFPVCSDLVVPRWISKISKYVDIFKICGRPCKNEWLFSCLDAYVAGDDVPLNVVTLSMCNFTTSSYLNTVFVNDAQLTCGNKCTSDCWIRQNVIHNYEMLCRLYGENPMQVF